MDLASPVGVPGYLVPGMVRPPVSKAHPTALPVGGPDSPVAKTLTDDSPVSKVVSQAGPT